MRMIRDAINWFQAIGERVDEKTLVLVMIVIAVVMAVCGVVAVISLDRDNAEMRMILEGLLKEKRAMEEEKNRCQK